jgi:hypothetical protein
MRICPCRSVSIRSGSFARRGSSKILTQRARLNAVWDSRFGSSIVIGTLEHTPEMVKTIAGQFWKWKEALESTGLRGAFGRRLSGSGSWFLAVLSLQPSTDEQKIWPISIHSTYKAGIQAYTLDACCDDSADTHRISGSVATFLILRKNSCLSPPCENSALDPEALRHDRFLLVQNFYARSKSLQHFRSRL